MTCKSQGKSRYYWGESHRSGWDRSLDHLNALKRRDESYAVVKHWLKDHPENQPQYEFKVMRSFRSSLERQIWESIFIDDEDPEVRLNSRSEWGANKVPRLIIDPESKYRQGEQDQDKGQGQDEAQSKDEVTEQSQGSSKRSRPEKIKVRSENENPGGMDACSSTRKKVKLSITDHFCPNMRGNPARNK